MTNMRERIANVLALQTGYTNGLASMPKDHRWKFLDRADKVLEAIYDPTNHMVDEAGGEYVNLERADDQCYQPRLIWQDMVDTARKEPR